MKNLTTQQRRLLKNQLEKAAKENNIEIIEQISFMQGKCVERKQNQALDILIDIKRDYIK